MRLARITLAILFQHNGNETALQHHLRAGRSQSVDGRQEVQRWIGHEQAKMFQIIMKTVQRKNQFIQRSESGDRANQDSPDSGAVYQHDRPHVAKTVEVATGAVHPESAA